MIIFGGFLLSDLVNYVNRVGSFYFQNVDNICLSLGVPVISPETPATTLSVPAGSLHSLE